MNPKILRKKPNQVWVVTDNQGNVHGVHLRAQDAGARVRNLTSITGKQYKVGDYSLPRNDWMI